MQKGMKYILVLGVTVALLAALLVPGCAPKVAPPAPPTETPPTQELPPIKIGLEMSMSGPTAYDGQHGIWGAELAAKEINEKGGILGGRTFEFVKRDHKFIPEEAVSAARKLIYEDKVKAIIGCEDASLALPLTDLVPDAGIPFIAYGADPDDWPPKGHIGTVRINCGSEQTAGAVARWAREDMGVKSFVMVGPDTPWLDGMYKASVEAFEELGGVTVFPLVNYTWGAPDLTAPYTKAVGYNADLMWGLAWSAVDIPREITQLHELGFKGIYMAVWNLVTPQVVKDTGAAAEGVYSLFLYDPRDLNPTNEPFVKAFVQAYGDLPNMWSAFAYEAMKLLAMGMENAGTDTGLEKIWKGMMEVEFTTLQDVPWEMTERGQKVYKTMRLYQIQEGQFVLLKEMPASPIWR